MPPSEPIKTAAKKKLYLNIISLVVLVAILIVLGSLVTIDKRKINSLNKSLLSSSAQVITQQKESRDLAFAVYPEQAYKTFRQQAYFKLYQQTISDASFKESNTILLRVFSTTSFKKADPLFAKIQNDDIVVYNNDDSLKTSKMSVIIVRPREQKVIAEGTIVPFAIKLARAGNISQDSASLMPQNFLSEQ